jgi:hypothetical protein
MDSETRDLEHVRASTETLPDDELIRPDNPPAEANDSPDDPTSAEFEAEDPADPDGDM